VAAGGSGGDICNIDTGTLVVSNTTFAGNSAAGGGSGGGISNSGTLTVSGCTFLGNSASSDGGGIENAGTLTMLNSTLRGNTAGSTGGGVENERAAALTNVTLTANRAAGPGGGIFNLSGSVTLYHTLVVHNFRGPAPGRTANDLGGTAVDRGSSFNLIGARAGGLVNGVRHNHVRVAERKLAPSAANGGPTEKLALPAGSPAIKADDDGVLRPPLPLTADPRRSGSQGDIGAFGM
jgi:hypothetical protein